jgi:hypothetical protein
VTFSVSATVATKFNASSNSNLLWEKFWTMACVLIFLMLLYLLSKLLLVCCQKVTILFVIGI